MDGERGDASAEVCVVIPVYNEAEVVRAVVAEARAVFPHVVCVDDGSSDASSAEVTAAGATLVRHPINLGQGAALQTGIEYALLDPHVRWIVTFDADGQHRVEDAVSMVEALRRDDADIVFGSRFLADEIEAGGLKRLVLRLAVLHSNLTSGVRLTDAHNGLRAFSRDVASQLAIRQSGMAHASEIVATVGRRKFRYIELPVHIRYTAYSRAKGQSLLNSVNIIFDLFFR